MFERQLPKIGSRIFCEPCDVRSIALISTLQSLISMSMPVCDARNALQARVSGCRYILTEHKDG